MPLSKPTRDELPRKLVVPEKCITASALRALANMMDRLSAFHHDKGGPAPDSPCLLDVSVEGGTVYARVSSGDHTYKLELAHGAWRFC